MSKRVGMLSVVERLSGSRFKCRCDCGAYRVVRVGHFNAGYFKSCGCHVVRHGQSSSREHVSWGNMIQRCHNSNNKRYSGYGAVGIYVCDSWRKSFVQFLSDMGACPNGYQIDRIDNNAGYSPKNCRWVTPKDNMANTAKSGVYTINGSKFASATDAARYFNVSVNTIAAWCKGRIAKDYRKKKKEVVTRKYKPKEGCSFKLNYD